ncbi:MAG: hypothetical protein RBR67_16635 [Desulfobacterium sp.]|nr:hypothetical protein [Desulfobacterium sp.]
MAKAERQYTAILAAAPPGWRCWFCSTPNSNVCMIRFNVTPQKNLKNYWQFSKIQTRRVKIKING